MVDKDKSERRRQALESFIKTRGLKPNAWAKSAGLNNANAIYNFLAGRSNSLSQGTAEALAHAAGVTVDAIFSEDEDSASNAGALGQSVPEIDVRGGMGGGGIAPIHNEPDCNGGVSSADDVRAHWTLPDEYLRGELHVEPSQIRIIEVRGDSMFPTLWPGDRIMIDLADQRPSPGGMFALWDGFGVVVKRLEMVPNSDPATVKIISDNDRHTTYEMTAEEINVIGRVAWFARKT